MSLPNETANLVAWFDAQAAQGFTDGAAVGSWRNETGGAPLTQAVSGQRPTFRAHAINDRPGIEFSAAGHASGSWPNLSGNQSDRLTPASGQLHVFVVFANATDDEYAAATYPGSYPLLFAVDHNWSLQAGPGWQTYTAAANARNDEQPRVATAINVIPRVAQILEMSFDGATLLARLNGQQVGADTVAGIIHFPAATIAGIGSADDAEAFFGLVGEVIVYDRVLLPLERVTSVEYLRTKWLVPVQHPAGTTDTPPDTGRTPDSALRSLKRYLAVALGDEWEVRLSREEGAFERPFTRVVQAGAATYPTNSGKFSADVIQPFAVYAYPLRGTTPDDALMKALTVEDALYRAVRAGTEHGQPLRIPLYNYQGVGLDQPGVWYPRAFMRVTNLSTQPFTDTQDNLLYTVVMDVRLAWRRALVPSTGPVLTDVTIAADPATLDHVPDVDEVPTP